MAAPSKFRRTAVKYDLTDDDISSIVNSALPSHDLTGEQISTLKSELSNALFKVYALLDEPEREVLELMKFRHIAAVPSELQTPTARWLLKAAGREYFRRLKAADLKAYDNARSTSGYVDPADHVEKLVDNFAEQAKEIASWLVNKEAVLKLLGPIDELIRQLITVDLPTIFERVFGQSCAMSRTGPGPSFILSVLRCARIEDGDFDKLAEKVYKARQRAASTDEPPETG